MANLNKKTAAAAKTETGLTALAGAVVAPAAAALVGTARAGALTLETRLKAVPAAERGEGKGLAPAERAPLKAPFAALAAAAETAGPEGATVAALAAALAAATLNGTGVTPSTRNGAAKPLAAAARKKAEAAGFSETETETFLAWLAVICACRPGGSRCGKGPRGWRYAVELA